MRQIALLLDGVFGSESVEYELEVGACLGSRSFQIGIETEKLYVADGYLSAEQRQYLELSGQTAYFQQLFSRLVVQYQVVDDNPVQQSYVYPPYCELAA